MVEDLKMIMDNFLVASLLEIKRAPVICTCMYDNYCLLFYKYLNLFYSIIYLGQFLILSGECVNY